MKISHPFPLQQRGKDGLSVYKRGINRFFRKKVEKKLLIMNLICKFKEL